jgi:porin
MIVEVELRRGVMKLVLGCALATGLALVSLPAKSQTATYPPGAGPGPQNSPPPVNVQPDNYLPFGTLTGDLGGIRSGLAAKGISIGVSYTSESAANVTGQRTGVASAGQFAVTNDIDWGTLASLTGFSTHFAGIDRYGSNLSGSFIGDHIAQATEAYGASFGAPQFVYGYGEQKMLNGHLEVAAGRLPIGADFATSQLACIAVSLTPACPTPRALANQTGFTDWPQSSWGARMRFRATSEFYVQTGVYEVEPFPSGGKSGLDWFNHDATGATIPLEVGWEPTASFNGLPGHYKIGVAEDTSRYPDLETNTAGQPIGIYDALPGQNHDGRTSFWFMTEQMIYNRGWQDDQAGSAHEHGGALMASYAHSTSDVSFNSDTAFIALVDRGLNAARPNDMVEFMGGWYGISKQAASLEETYLALGRPLPDGANGVQRNEYMLEANYTTSPFRGVAVQPAVTYFIHPNADSTVKNALTFELRVNVLF